MNKFTLSLSVLLFCVLSGKAQITFSFQCTSSSSVITCAQPFVNFFAISSHSATVNYVWVNGTTTLTGNYVTISAPGNYTVTAQAGTLTNSQILSVSINTSVPSGFLVPTNQTITCNLAGITSVSAAAVGTSTNISHSILSPYGGTFVSASFTTVYSPAAPGTYTHFLINTENGCSASQQFTVTSSIAYPTFDLYSINLYSLGCGPFTVGVVQLQNGQSNPPAQLSYTLLSPTASSVLPAGLLSLVSTYTYNSAGTYTAVMRENNSGCEARVPFTVIQNTAASISVVSNDYTISCLNPTVYAQALGVPAFTAVSWSWPFGTTNSPTCAITNIGPVQPFICYVTGTTAARCNVTQTVLIYGNKELPYVTAPFTPFDLCNKSSTSIFPNIAQTQRVYTYSWTAPAGATLSALNGSACTVTQPGTYTVSVYDTQNYCEKSLTFFLSDCVGLEKRQSHENISIAPNPATDFLNFVFEGDRKELFDLEVIDLTGKIVITKAAVSLEPISIKALPTGIYHVKLSNHTSVHCIKLLIQ